MKNKKKLNEKEKNVNREKANIFPCDILLGILALLSFFRLRQKRNKTRKVYNTHDYDKTLTYIQHEMQYVYETV